MEFRTQPNTRLTNHVTSSLTHSLTGSAPLPRRHTPAVRRVGGVCTPLERSVQPAKVACMLSDASSRRQMFPPLVITSWRIVPRLMEKERTMNVQYIHGADPVTDFWVCRAGPLRSSQKKTTIRVSS